MNYLIDFLQNFWELTLEAAPWLAFGLLVAGMIRMWLPQHMLQRWLGGRGMGAVTRAAVVGTPLPLCSCSVLPAALALRRGGASRGSTTSFLIATPENGVDSIALSYALLGPFMAVVRPVAAFICALFAGALTEISEVMDQRKAGPYGQGGDSQDDERTQAPPVLQIGGCCDSEGDTAGCCGSEPQAEQKAEQTQTAESEDDGCCGGHCGDSQEPASTTWTGRTVQTLRYGFVDFYSDILGWLVIGLILAAVLATLFPPESISAWGSGIPAMLGMLVIGIPMYICATASTPVAASLLLAGVSPGTVLVFLLAGPATNLASIGVVRRELGTPALAAYLLAIGVGSIVAGLLTDVLASAMSINIVAQTEQGGHLIPYWLKVGSAALLIGLALWFGLRWVLGKIRAGKSSTAAPRSEPAPLPTA